MEKDNALQNAVLEAIKWEPLLRNTTIVVTAANGIVTLSGVVDSYAKKQGAEHAAKMVAGVKAVVGNIGIDFGGLAERADAVIAGELLEAIKWNQQFPHNKVTVKVEHGWVTLEGELTWNYQRDEADKLVNTILGVKGLTDKITILPVSGSNIEKQAIKNALGSNWSVTKQGIEVDVSGNMVTLRGKVHSFYQKEEAGRIAWKTPGVGQVYNKLVIEYN